MEYNKLYQYRGLTRVSAFNYAGTLAVTLNNDSNNNVYSPVNTILNAETVGEVIVSQDTLSNQEDGE